MKGWQKDIFDNFIKLNRGFDLPEKDIVEGVYPIVASTSIKAFHKDYKINPPAVVTGRSGSLGVVQYITKKCWPLNTSLYVKNFKGNIPKYVFYFLKTLRLENFNSGVGVPSLNQNHLHKLTIKIPPLPIQRKIAAVLSAYDDLIENNNRRIAILEKMAEELYREWFVRLRFPGHEKVNIVKGVPEGWEVKELATICYDERRLIRKKNISDKTRYIGLEHISPKSTIIKEFGYARNIQSDKLIFNPMDILYGKIRPYLHKISIAHFSGVCSSDTIVIKSKTSEYQAFVYLTVSSDSFVDLATTASTGTKMPRADWDFLSRQKIVIPNSKLLKTFQKLFDNLFSSICNYQKKSEILTTTRDRLLSRLMSGKIDLENLDIAFPKSMMDEPVVEPGTSTGSVTGENGTPVVELVETSAYGLSDREAVEEKHGC